MITIISKYIGGLFLVMLIMSFGNASAQAKTYVFNKALFAEAGAHYGREALYTDTLAWQMYSGY